jgi:putative glutamine amidotransferase
VTAGMGGRRRPRVGVTRGSNSVAAYRAALEAAGADVVEIGAADPVASAAWVARVDALLVPGGRDVDPRAYGEVERHATVEVEPDRDRLELAAVRVAVDRGVPVLGICRGIQVLNVALGGSLWQDLPSQRPSYTVHKEPAAQRDRRRLLHAVVVQPGTRLHAVLGTDTLWVNSMHHQAVREPAPGLRPVAAAADGTIEAVEAPGAHFVLGVQWHPEELFEEGPHRALFDALCAAAQARGD